MNIQSERRSNRRRLNSERRKHLDYRYEDPEFYHLIDRRTDKARRNGDRRKQF
ncbi:MAG: hypothetical protein HY279_10280 [Nitrospinae bacterium]|nr:hypothetical protein [Nitrospinota bacterium]